MIDSLILRTGSRALAPVMLVVSLWLLWRGHNAPGGGFIGGLTGGAAVVLLYLSSGHSRVWENTILRVGPLLGGGLLVAVAYGVGGIVVKGSFLASGKVALPGDIELAASLIFDVGVYLIVAGMVSSIVRHLGRELLEAPPTPPELPSRDRAHDGRADR